MKTTTLENTADALVLDYYGTIADPAKTDALLKPYKTEDSFSGIYIEGAARVLSELKSPYTGIDEKVRETYKPGMERLVKKAKDAGMKVLVYSSGNSDWIKYSADMTLRERLSSDSYSIDAVVTPDEVGSKKEALSYQKLKEQYNLGRTIYVTDDKKEARAASDAGYDRVHYIEKESKDYSAALKSVEELSGGAR